MRKLFKGFSVVMVLMLASLFCEKTYAANAYFVWEKTEIDVPVFSALEAYKDDYVLKLYVNGVESNDFYVEYETNCSTFSTVLTHRIGRYTVYYKAYSKANYISSEQAIVFNVVDVTAPQFNLKSTAINISFGKTLDNINWYTVSDDTSGVSDIMVEVDEARIDYKTLGLYQTTATATDLYGNQSVVEFTVNVIDNVSPEIKVIKQPVFNFGDEVILSDYFQCIDNCDGDITYLLESEGLDTAKLGRQQITLVVEDHSNNETKVVYDVLVEDKEPPILTFDFDELILDIRDYNLFDEEYFVSLISISDNCSLVDDIRVIVDLSELAECISDYTIYVTAKDENNNDSDISFTIKIREFIGPELIVDDVIEIYVGEEIDLLSMVEVVDPYDLDAASRLMMDAGDFDSNKSGTYSVKYTCFNTSGIYSEKIVTVNVNESIEDSTLITGEYLMAVLMGVGISAVAFIVVVIIKKKLAKKE